jgi:hypothetical protein
LQRRVRIKSGIIQLAFAERIPIDARNSPLFDSTYGAREQQQEELKARATNEREGMRLCQVVAWMSHEEKEQNVLSFIYSTLMTARSDHKEEASGARGEGREIGKSFVIKKYSI